jgi:metal-responsive CopG/Arc/MetJ family transcriptional regulator
MALARTNVTIPEALLREVDELAGPRGRSAFVAEAIEARVKRERLRRALDAVKGVYKGTSFDMDDEAAYRWVRDLREDREDDDRG